VNGRDRCGMRAPVLAVGDGAPGLWNGLREVLPQAREGRCWFQRTANARPPSPSPPTPRRRGPWRRSGTPRTRTTHWPRSRPSMPPTAPDSPRPRQRSPRMRTSCWRSMTTRASTGCTCGPLTRSKVHLPRSSTARRSPKGRAHGRPGGHGVHAHRVRARPLARHQRTPTSSPWSASGKPSSTANSSNDRARTPNRKPPKRA
jgi:hypothetical protein